MPRRPSAIPAPTQRHPAPTQRHPRAYMRLQMDRRRRRIEEKQFSFNKHRCWIFARRDMSLCYRASTARQPVHGRLMRSPPPSPYRLNKIQDGPMIACQPAPPESSQTTDGQTLVRAAGALWQAVQFYIQY